MGCSWPCTMSHGNFTYIKRESWTILLKCTFETKQERITVSYLLQHHHGHTNFWHVSFLERAYFNYLEYSYNIWYICIKSIGIDADASKGETSSGYFNSNLVYSYKCRTIVPWEFPEISLAYSHIFLKGSSRSIIYGQIFWPPHPHPHIASPASLYHQNQLSFVFRFSFHLTIHFENAGNICNKYDL